MKKTVFFLFISIFFASCMQQGFVTGREFVEEEPEIIEPKLTLMIYMAADNDLEAYALQNLHELKAGGCPQVKVIVLLDRAEGYD